MKIHHKLINDIRVVFRVNEGLETVSYTFTLNGETYTHTVRILENAKMTVRRMRHKAKLQIEEVRNNEHTFN